MIRAIDTIYNGYKFRSRLEARWAVFFDYLKIYYEYEKEGYKFDGEHYLPDFFLPNLDLFIEIKDYSKLNAIDDRDIIKARKFSRYHRILIVYGQPKAGAYLIEDCNFPKEEKYVFCQRRFCRNLGIGVPEPITVVNDVEGILHHPQSLNKNCYETDCPCFQKDNSPHEDLISAYFASCRKRFEHGEGI